MGHKKTGAVVVSVLLAMLAIFACLALLGNIASTEAGSRTINELEAKGRVQNELIMGQAAFLWQCLAAVSK